jgi:ferric enterobactin receptor
MLRITNNKIHTCTCVLTIFLLLAVAPVAKGQDTSEVKINEYYWGTPLVKVLDDFKNKYKIPIQYKPEEAKGQKFDFLFTNTPASRAIEIVFRNNTILGCVRDSNNVYQVILRSILNASKLTSSTQKFEGKPVKFHFSATGIIKDKLSGEPLPFASVMVKGTTNGCSSNVDGYFTLPDIPSDTCAILAIYLGYYKQTFFLSPYADVNHIVIMMDPVVTKLKETEIKGQREDLLRASEGGNLIKMAPAKIAELPSLGEKDIFRTFQLMPGIGGSSGSSAGLYVRGGTPDQNLILYDGFTVYHQEHLFGMFSAFNPNAIKEVQLYKGGFEAKYGGRLSSVMEIIGKTGNDQKFNAGCDFGFIGFNAYTEIPLKGKGSVFLAARRSYKTFLYQKFFDSFSQDNGSNQVVPVGAGPGGMPRNIEEQQPTSYFYDLNAKITYKFTLKDIVSYSFFSGQDYFDNSRDMGNSRGGMSMDGGITDLTKWGNWGSSVKWSRKWSEKLYSNNLLSVSDYSNSKDRSDKRTITLTDGTSSVFNNGSVESNDLIDICFKTDNEWKLNTLNQIEFGAQYNHYDIKYKFIQNDTLTILDMINNGNLVAGYIQDRLNPMDKKMTILPGIRISYYSNSHKPYIEPRFQWSYNLTEKFKVKASTGLYYQFANRIIREDIQSGNRDIWVLSNGDNIPVSRAIHYIAGASYETKDYLFDAEAYYKQLSGLTEYTLRFSHRFGESVDYSSLFYEGSGYTRGVDLMAQKKFGKFSGWIAYTLSETRYKFPVYGDGYFSASQDVTNELKFVAIYKIKKWTLSGTWVYSTGLPYTQPIGGYVLTMPDGTTQSVIIPGTKNAARLPDYHRLDLAVKYDISMGETGKGTIGFSLFNVYNRKNIWYKEFSVDATGLIETNVNLLGITPNVSLTLQIR